MHLSRPHVAQHKGATSGNVQRVRELGRRCDADAVPHALVDPAGPACTGEHLLHRVKRTGAAEVPGPVSFEALPEFERTLEARRAERQGCSSSPTPS